jgi:hypothetical protein
VSSFPASSPRKALIRVQRHDIVVTAVLRSLTILVGLYSSPSPPRLQYRPPAHPSLRLARGAASFAGLGLHWFVQQPPSITTHSEVWSYVRASEQPRDTRPRDSIDVGRAWVRGRVRMGEARSVGVTLAGQERAITAKYSSVATRTPLPTVTAQRRSVAAASRAHVREWDLPG